MKAFLSKQAKKHLDKLPKKNIREKIVSAIKNIPLGDVKPLKGKYQGFYRLRVSNYRILFKREGDTIYVYRIDVRGDVYK